MTITITLNAERGGIEIRFPSVPDRKVRSRLLDAGWRFTHSLNVPRWYAKRTPKSESFAATLKAELEQPKPFEPGERFNVMEMEIA